MWELWVPPSPGVFRSSNIRNRSEYRDSPSERNLNLRPYSTSLVVRSQDAKSHLQDSGDSGHILVDFGGESGKV